jgi:hypothetical protein
MTALRDFQDGFAAALLAEETPVVALDAHPALTVYRNNVRSSLVRALADLYPVAAALVGDDCFTELASRFIAHYPPRGPVLIGWGGELADIIAAEPIFAGLPYLPDIARLEFALHQAYHAPDATPLVLCAFRSLPPAALSTLHIGLHPSVVLLASDHPVDAIWRAHHAPDVDAALAAIAPRTARLLIARPGADVELRTLGDAEFAAVAEFADGTPPADAAVLAALFDAGLILSTSSPENVR